MSSSRRTTAGKATARIGPDNNKTVRSGSAVTAFVLVPETCSDFTVNKLLSALNREAQEAREERRQQTRPCATGSTDDDWCPHFLSSSWSRPYSRQQDGESTAVAYRDAESDEETASFVSGSEMGDSGAVVVSGIKNNWEEIMMECNKTKVKDAGMENTQAGLKAQKRLNVSQVGDRPPAETLDLATWRPDYSIDAFLKALTVEKRVRGRSKTFPPSTRYSHGEFPSSSERELIDRVIQEYRDQYIVLSNNVIESAGVSRQQTQRSLYCDRSLPSEMPLTPRVATVTRSMDSADRSTESTFWRRAFRCCFGFGQNSDSRDSFY